MANKNDIVRTGGNGRRSSCVAYGGLVYLSAITTVDIEADTAGQTKDVLAQIDRLLAMNETDKTRVLSATVHLKDMHDFAAFNAVWDEWVTDAFEPARSVQQAELSLAEYRVAISLVAAQ